MDRKLIIVLSVLALFVSLTGLAAVAHENMPDMIIIDKVQARKPPVTLNHEKHGEELGCQACHHIETADAEPESCFNCHGKDPDIPDPSSGKKDNPFHMTCRGCHKEKGKGPVKCTECHKKAE
jgi:hypothetical protein